MTTKQELEQLDKKFTLEVKQLSSQRAFCLTTAERLLPEIQQLDEAITEVRKQIKEAMN